ncbi:hypothetical protein BDW74DRAFT_181841 [Aspergillus multicolor]|uniref:SET domain-containing protein n=1 Tax=Aspergillus multicolor TaxID=41759 RepID=UPI003CCCD06D
MRHTASTIKPTSLNRQAPATDAMYTVKNIPGKGKGLVATERISQGTRILCEELIIQSPGHLDQLSTEKLESHIKQQVDTLTDEQRREFLALHHIYTYTTPAEQYLGIIRTNALQTDDVDGQTAGGIFLLASRLNHACDNNAQKARNPNIKQQTVHALRDIAQGEEITIYYLGAHNSRSAHDESAKNDEILEEIERLDGLVSDRGLQGILSSPLQTLRHLDREIQLLRLRTGIFAERAERLWRISEGDDGENVDKTAPLARDRSQLSLYGMSMRWRTAVDDVPVGLGTAEFEDWLWRRENASAAGPRMQTGLRLRNRATFPAFSALPHKWGADMDYYDGSGRPRRHWCLLAEIVDFDFLTRLHLEIRDVDGMKIQKGYTVAILYAQRHSFEFDSSGIRLEDPARIKIFPTSLQMSLATATTTGHATGAGKAQPP